MKKRTAGVVAIAGLIAALAAGSTAIAFAATGSAAPGSTSTSMPAPPAGSRPTTGTPGPGGFGGGRGHGGGGMMGVGLVEVVAKLTGESTATVSAARQAGTSFAKIASAKSVTVAQVVELASAAPKAALASEVSNGLLTQAQSDTEAKELTTRLTAEVNATGTMGPGGPHDGRGHGGPPPAASGTGSTGSGVGTPLAQ